jgi:acyl-CoA thioester hydrolase
MSRNALLRHRAIYPFFARDTVRFSDTDAAGHVNNVSICAWLETGRLSFMRHIGMMNRAPPLRGISAGLNVSFLRESHWPGEVEIGCGILSIGRSSAVVAGAVFRGEDCIAAAEMPVVQLSASDPAPWTEAQRQDLQRWLVKPSPGAAQAAGD